MALGRMLSVLRRRSFLKQKTSGIGMGTFKTKLGANSALGMLLSQNIARLKDSDLRVLYGNIIYNIRMVCGGICASATK